MSDSKAETSTAALPDGAPKGLFFKLNVISEEDERNAIAFLSKQDWSPLWPLKKASEKITIKVDTGRKVLQYGFRFDYHSYALKADVPAIPKELQKFVDILELECKERGLDVKLPHNQIIVNRYAPGEGISPHTDANVFGPVIGCFTLGDGGPLEFTKGTTKQSFTLQTQPRSLYIMSGDSRDTWKHSMPARKKDRVGAVDVARGTRISVTIRQVPKA